MELGTLSDIVVAIAAVAALVLSIYNYRFQKREARLRREEMQEEARLRREEMLPSLKVSSDTRIPWGKPLTIYSCRVVNDGHVPVEIRTLRIFLEDERTLPMPGTDEELLPDLWENEKPIPISPTVLQPGQSMRFATSKNRLEYAVRNTGFSGRQFYEVAVIDALGNSYTTEESAYSGSPDPEP